MGEDLPGGPLADGVGKAAVQMTAALSTRAYFSRQVTDFTQKKLAFRNLHPV